MSTDEHPSHVYTTPGNYTVSLTVLGPSGYDTEVKTNYIDISAGPYPDFSVDTQTTAEGTIVNFTDNSSSDGTIEIWSWNFGDGSTYTGSTSNHQNPSHEYTEQGTYNVTLEITDNYGTKEIIKENFITVNASIIVNFSVNDETPEPGDTVNFTNESTSIGTITDYLWDFGDGDSSTNENPSHTYINEGSYDVSLSVTDQYGTEILNKPSFINVITLNGSVGNYGYSMGGGTDSYALSKIIDRLTFPFDSGNVSYVGDLNTSDAVGAGFNSSQYGYCSSGGIVQRITFPLNSGTASLVGALSQSMINSSGFNSSQHGYVMGAGNLTSFIQRIDFASDNSISESVGHLLLDRQNAFSCNSSNYGYAMGGMTSGVIIHLSVDRITFPFDTGNASTKGDLDTSRYAGSGCNSTVYGFAMGGGNTPAILMIDRISFPFDVGNSTPKGDLIVERFNTQSGVNSTQHGYIMGGSQTTGAINYVKSIDRITFPFDTGNALTKGDLSGLRYGNIGCDETDFNTMFMDISSGFSGSPLSGEINTEVTFDSSSSTGFIDTYSWDFGDTNTSTHKNPSHIYNTEGTFDVNLTVSNTVNNDIETKIDYITITSILGDVGDYGYSVGGLLGTTASSVVDRMLFPFNSGTASVAGSLTVERSETAACNSSEYGFVFAGADDDNIPLNTTERLTFTFGATVPSVSKGTLSNACVASTACNSSQYGFNMGGNYLSSVVYDTVDKISFPFETGNALAASLLLYERSNTSACNSSTHGLIMGGYNKITAAKYNNIESILFPYDSGPSVSMGILSENRISGASCNSSQYGFCMGGSDNNYSDTIDRIDFIGTVLLRGNLSATKSNAASFNSSTHGFVAGGYNHDQSYIVVDRIEFPFDTGDSQLVGNLSETKFTNVGCDETDFNTMFMDVSAEFSGSPTTTGIGTNVDFTNSSTGFIDSYSWTFEGGTPATSTDENPTITYNSEGTYDVSLTVANTINNNIKTKVDYINVISYGVPQSEVDALEAFYDATGGTSWINDTNWKTLAPVSTWHGITVFGGHITEINLNNNNLVGSAGNTLDPLANNLSRLNFNTNLITIIDTTNLINLTYLDCQKNSITNINLINLINLTYLNFYDNNLNTLDVSNLTNLTTLNCSSCNITTLDVSNLTNLTNLDCSNYNITTLDVSNLTNLTNLNCSSCNITTLDVSNLTNLTNLNCSNCNITTLDVSNLTNLTTLYCGFCNLTTLDVSNLTNLTTLNCSNCNLTTLDVSNLTNLVTLRCEYNSLTTLDTSNLINLTHFYGRINNFITLDLTSLTNLIYLDCIGSNLTTLNVSNLTNLVTLFCQENSLTTLDVSSLTNLVTLRCQDNSLTTLDVSNLTNLNEVTCYNNNIATFDILASINISSLDCHNNALDESSVDNILCYIINNSAIPVGAIDISGTNAAPSATGLVCKTSLEGNGWNVTVTT